MQFIQEMGTYYFNNKDYSYGVYSIKKNKSFSGDPYKYIQDDNRWKNVKMSDSTLGKVGCFITTLANVFEKDGVTINGETCNPENLLQYIKDKGFINSKDEIIPADICKSLNYSYVRENVNKYDAAKDIILNMQKQGMHVIMQIDYCGTHFLNVIKVDESKGSIICHDPLKTKNGNQVIELNEDLLYRGKTVKIKSIRGIFNSLHSENNKTHYESEGKHTENSDYSDFMSHFSGLSFSFPPPDLHREIFIPESAFSFKPEFVNMETNLKFPEFKFQNIQIPQNFLNLNP